MPSQGQRLRARHRFARMLPDRATIQRSTDAPDGGGGLTQTWAPLAADVPCRLAPVGGGEDSARGGSGGGDRISDSATAIVTFRAGQDVTEADRIVIAGQTFDVQLVRRRGEYELTRRVEVKEV